MSHDDRKSPQPVYHHSAALYRSHSIAVNVQVDWDTIKSIALDRMFVLQNDVSRRALVRAVALRHAHDRALHPVRP
eukprot:290340-Chlamydomonas_euryale.AAC.1